MKRLYCKKPVFYGTYDTFWELYRDLEKAGFEIVAINESGVSKASLTARKGKLELSITKEKKHRATDSEPEWFLSAGNEETLRSFVRCL